VAVQQLRMSAPRRQRQQQTELMRWAADMEVDGIGVTTTGMVERPSP
jgi:hypothetical protein